MIGIDYTAAAVEKTRALLHTQHLKAEVIQADVLTYQPHHKFDAVYEQTCLCAIHPEHWVEYAQQLQQWIKSDGSLWVMYMQMLRSSASDEGVIHGPPYHCDINAMRALFTEKAWVWPKPPYAKVNHPNLSHELAVRIVRR